MQYQYGPQQQKTNFSKLEIVQKLFEAYNGIA